jgi:transmembrane sensor
MFGGVANNSEQTMDINFIKDLLDRYIAGSATPEEQRIIEKWLEANEFPENHWSSMDAQSKAAVVAEINLELKKTIDNNPLPRENKIFSPLPWYRRLYVQLAAASVIIIAADFGWYYIFQATEIQTAATAEKTIKIKQNDIAPGTNKAILMLDGGDTVVLDDSHNGVLATQGNTQVSKKGGLLVYNSNRLLKTEKVVTYNTLVTPRGGQYQLILPDGSKVWLNAASSIRYPVIFADDIREVEIKGEAYFEVVPHLVSGKKIPFNVKIMSAGGEEKSVVEVLGTHFNINAYDEEASMNTTLLQGKVRVTPGAYANTKNTVVLAPGQQAQVNTNGKSKVIYNADVDEAVAWKNGLFLMNRVGIAVMLRQIARWYDVEIVYVHGIPEGRISGDIPRSMQLSEVLRVLELSGVTFKIAGKKIIVEPN